MCVMVSSFIIYTFITTIQFPLSCVMYVTHVKEGDTCGISPSSICISVSVSHIRAHMYGKCAYISNFQMLLHTFENCFSFFLLRRSNSKATSGQGLCP